MKVVLYSQPGCLDCEAAEEFLRQRGVPLEKKNVREDREALHELLAMGCQSTPTIVIDGLVFEGFTENRQKISRALALKLEQMAGSPT